ncbi:MAG: DUF4911 domain-containing protein [Deltaproteobacteria bacterium]|nr:DUF4911 domain-containing protein [Deltaproteobacteria bacterium]
MTSDPLPTRSLRRVFHVDRKDIGYLRFTLESYDGMAVVSTLDPQPALIEVLIAPGCEMRLTALLDSLRKEGKGMTIEDAPVSA